MSPQKKVELSFWEKFRALRMTLESIFFQTDAFSEKDRAKPKIFKALLGVLVLALVQFLLLGIWVSRDIQPLRPEETAGVNAVYEYSRLWSEGDLKGLFTSLTGADGAPMSPLYYWFAVPVVKLLPIAGPKAIVLFNSFYIGLIGLFIFFIVRYNRVDKSGWLAACFAMCLPFVLNSAKLIAPDIAVIAWAAGCYAGFIWSDDFEKPKPSYWFGVFFLLGLLTTWNFPLYVLPILMYLVNGLLNYYSRKWCLNIIFISLGAYCVWLWINLPVLLMWLLKSALWQENAVSAKLSSLGKVTWYFWQSVDGMTLFMFVAAAAAFAWMLSAEFMAYPKRKTLLHWLGVTYVVLIFVPAKEARFFWPALIAMAPAVGIMTPKPARWWLAGLCLFVALGNQTGLLSAKSVTFAGHSITVLGSYSAGHEDDLRPVFSAAGKYVSESEPYTTGLALNPPPRYSNAFLTLQARNCGYPRLSFVDDSGLFYRYPDFVLDFSGYKPVASSGIFTSSGPAAANAWFNAMYENAGSFQVRNPQDGNMYAVSVYGRKKLAAPPLALAQNELGDLTMGGWRFIETSLSLGEWNAEKGCYSRALLFPKVLRVDGVDIFGAAFALDNFSFYLDGRELRVTGATAVKVARGMVFTKTLGEYIEQRFPQMKNFSLDADSDKLNIKFSYNGKAVVSSIAFEERVQPPGFVFSVRSLSLAWFGFPSALAQTQKYELDFRPSPERPFALSFAPVHFYGGSIKAGFPPPDQNSQEDMTNAK